MIKNNKILQVGVWYLLLIIVLSWIWFFPHDNVIGPIIGIFYAVVTFLLYFWVFKTIDRSAFLINIIFICTFLMLIFLFRSYIPLGLFLSLPNFVFLFGFILACWIPVYLVPKFPTAYNAILISQFKEVSILGGLIGAFVGWVLMGSHFGSADVSLLDQLDYLMIGFHSAIKSVLYGLCLSLIVFGSSRIDNNITPDQGCFEKVEMGKRINFRSMFAFPVLLATSVGSIAFAVYVEGAPGDYRDFFQLGSIPLILFIFLSATIRSGNWNYLGSLKILIYNKYGEYDIRQTLSTIYVIKQIIIYSTIFLLIMLFAGSLSLNLTKTFQLVSAISAILFSLFIVYFIIVIQNIEILQNAILNDKFDDYQHKETSSGIYIVSSIYIGILSFIVLLNLIRT